MILVKIITMEACIMNSTIGFLVSYLVGLPCSKMPPWGTALFVLEAVADVALTVWVMISVTVAEAMLNKWLCTDGETFKGSRYAGENFDLICLLSVSGGSRRPRPLVGRQKGRVHAAKAMPMVRSCADDLFVCPHVSS